MDLHLSISNGFVSSKSYDKRKNFDFDTVNFLFFDGDIPRSTSYGVYILSLFSLLEYLVKLLFSVPVIKVRLPNFSYRTIGIINFERPPNFIADTMNSFLNSKFNVGLKTLLHQVIGTGFLW